MPVTYRVDSVMLSQQAANGFFVVADPDFRAGRNAIIPRKGKQKNRNDDKDSDEQEGFSHGPAPFPKFSPNNLK